MKIFFRLLSAAAVVLLVFVETAPAQRTHGYAFAAPGAAGARDDIGSFLHVGIGGEAALPMRVGIGGEVGIIGPPGDIFSESEKLASVSGYGHFPTPGPLDPYLFVGYSALLQDESTNGLNFGVGANLPLWNRLGFKFEFRGHIFSDINVTSHWWQGRFALIF